MKFKSFFDAFPPPEFLNIPYAGVSISDNHVRCLQFANKENKLVISKFAERPVPSGAVVSGDIKNAPEVVKILESIKKDLNLGFIKVSLPEEKAYLFTAKLPVVAESELRSAIEFKMEENVPVPASELVFDYAVTDAQKNADHIKVVVSALPVNVVDKYIETVNTAGMQLLSLEIESQAVARAVLPKHESGTSLIVHFGKEKAGLYVVVDHTVRFTSTITTKGRPADDLESVSQEIKKLYMYWHTLKENYEVESRKISQIVVCGDGELDGAVSYLSLHAKTPAMLGNVWTNAFNINETVPQISFSDSLRYAPAVGLALPSEILL